MFQTTRPCFSSPARIAFTGTQFGATAKVRRVRTRHEANGRRIREKGNRSQGDLSKFFNSSRVVRLLRGVKCKAYRGTFIVLRRYLEKTAIFLISVKLLLPPLFVANAYLPKIIVIRPKSGKPGSGFFYRWDVSAIYSLIVWKLAEAVFISQYFRT